MKLPTETTAIHFICDIFCDENWKWHHYFYNYSVHIWVLNCWSVSAQWSLDSEETDQFFGTQCEWHSIMKGFLAICVKKKSVMPRDYRTLRDGRNHRDSVRDGGSQPRNCRYSTVQYSTVQYSTVQTTETQQTQKTQQIQTTQTTQETTKAQVTQKTKPLFYEPW